MFGIDATYKIIPHSFKTYKILTIYCYDFKEKKSIIAVFLCSKFNDYNSLIKIFSLLSAIYNFSPVSITTDFYMCQIKALKEYIHFKRKPYIICCFFHFYQSITVFHGVIRLSLSPFSKSRHIISLYCLYIFPHCHSTTPKNPGFKVVE